MRLNIKLFNLGTAAILGVLLATGCTNDENISPLDNVALEERSLIGTAPSVPLVGLTPTNELVLLLSGPPVVEKGVVPITGLRIEESMLAIDFRFKTRELYGISNQGYIYKISPVTGLATQVSQFPITPALTGETVGFDFNPADDLIRLVTDQGQNLRISPVTGQVVGVDVNLNPGTPAIQGAAYSYGNKYSKAALYDIDAAQQALFVQNPADAGVLERVGLLGFVFSGEGGFEITNKNLAFAVQYGKSLFPGTDAGSGNHDVITEDAYRLLSINLIYGSARSYGRVRPMIGLASR